MNATEKKELLSALKLIRSECKKHKSEVPCYECPLASESRGADQVCAKANKTGIEDFGYGKGWHFGLNRMFWNTYTKTIYRLQSHTDKSSKQNVSLLLMANNLNMKQQDVTVQAVCFVPLAYTLKKAKQDFSC